jgi:hypothetical protein
MERFGGVDLIKRVMNDRSTDVLSTAILSLGGRHFRAKRYALLFVRATCTATLSAVEQFQLTQKSNVTPPSLLLENA